MAIIINILVRIPHVSEHWISRAYRSTANKNEKKNQSLKAVAGLFRRRIRNSCSPFNTYTNSLVVDVVRRWNVTAIK